MLKIFVTNLRAYNNGELRGQWVSLPNDNLEEICNRIKVNKYDELFISDFDTDLNIRINEFDNIFDLNEAAKEIAELDEYELLGLNAYLEMGEDLEYAIQHAEDIVVYNDCFSMEDVAYQYMEETGMINSIPEELQCYFDYNAFGCTMECESTFVSYSNGFIQLVA